MDNFKSNALRTEAIVEKKSGKKTPLEMALANVDRPPATPLGVFKLARRYWLQSKRIGIGELAKEVGVSRVTLYRWVGSKERLIEEVLWSFAKPAFAQAIMETLGTGVEHIVGVHRHFMTTLSTFQPMRRFIIENPTVALRIQTKDPKSAHGRVIEAAAAHISEQEHRGYMRLPSSASKIAEMIVYASGALLYSGIIGDRASTAIEQACAINRMLLLGEIPYKSPDASET